MDKATKMLQDISQENCNTPPDLNAYGLSGLMQEDQAKTEEPKECTSRQDYQVNAGSLLYILNDYIICKEKNLTAALPSLERVIAQWPHCIRWDKN